MNKINNKSAFLNKLNIVEIFEDNIKEPHEVFFISYHDHWLTEEESGNTAMSWEDFNSGNGEPGDYADFEENFLNAFADIFKAYTVISYLPEKDSYEPYAFDSFDELKELLTESLKERKECNLVIPELETVILSNPDLTWPVYSFGEDAYEIQGILQGNQIHILD